MLPEERARKKIDHQLQTAGWDIVSRDEYIPNSASAVKEALMQGNTESDYLFFVDHKAVAVLEAKREENLLNEDVQEQAENYPLLSTLYAKKTCISQLQEQLGELIKYQKVLILLKMQTGLFFKSLSILANLLLIFYFCAETNQIINDTSCSTQTRDKTHSRVSDSLPPLAEQKRIVAKLEELLPLCEG